MSNSQYIYTAYLHITRSFFIIVFMLTILPAMGQDITGKWVSHTTSLKGREHVIKDKKQRTVLILRKDSSYTKQSYEHETPANLSTYVYSFSGNAVEVRDSKGNILKQHKQMENGTYTFRKVTNEILLNAKGGSETDHYTIEKGQLILAIPTAPVLKNTDKYMYVKFNREKKL